MTLFLLGGILAAAAMWVQGVGGTAPQDGGKTGATGLSSPAAESAARGSARAIRVIGNRDSKRYHLPGMLYYDRVDAHHRREFLSEEEALAAGYRRAPR